MRVEPATVAQSEAPMADLVADFSADVTRPWGSPFVTT
jgi:hypothetical protein